MSGFPGITCVTFFPPFFRSAFRPPKIPQRRPRRAKKRPNDPPNDPKSVPKAPQNRYFRIRENSQKPLFLLWFRHIGPSSFGRFGDQNGDRRADRPTDTQKPRKCRPSGAQGRKNSENGPPGGGGWAHFSDLFSISDPLGAQLGSPGRPVGPRARFRVMFRRF